MNLKVLALISVIVFSTLCALSTTVIAQVPQNEVCYYALIICGVDAGANSFPRDTAYMYHVLSRHYIFDEIYYLHTDTSATGVNASATKANIRWVIRTWLSNKSDSNDVIFIYFSDHGCGYNDDSKVLTGRIDGSMSDPIDEGWEIWNETIGQWVGVDESLCLKGTGEYEDYWDDELAEDLDTLEYGTLVIAVLARYSGGLIDDLSGTNRIIMTAANETHICLQNYYGEEGGYSGTDDLYSEWSEVFIDALHGEDTYWNPEGAIVHKGVPVDADFDCDGHVSMWEAWKYAWDHDDARIHGNETNWLDDNGNKLPTYINETDHLDGTDGSLANNTWFPRRHYNLTVKTRTTSGSEISDVKVWIDGDLEYSPTIANVTAEYHNVTVETAIYLDNVEYQFAFWEDGSTSNQRMVHIDINKTIIAYYSPPSGGCPFLYAWNGTNYIIDNNLLPASATSGGADVEDYYRLERALVPEEGKYSLLIKEFEQEHSYFDQARLLAVDHESDVGVAVSPSGEILTYKDPHPPVSCLDSDGNDVLNVIKSVDNQYYEGNADDYLLLDFGDLDISQGAKLVMRADYPYKKSIHVQVQDEDGNWESVASVIPRVYWATEIVDLSSHLPDANGELKVRLYFTGNHKIDYVGLGTSEQADLDVHSANLALAIHSEEGNVKPELLQSDGFYAELLPGQQIELMFTLPKNSKNARTYILYVKGHYYTITMKN